MTSRVPLRRSLLVRLLATSVLVALCSIAATAWLAVQSTTRAIQQAQGQALSDDVKIYDALIGYAATHKSWAGVEPTIKELAADTGRQISLTSLERVPIAGVANSPGPDTAVEALPQKESAVIDPLHTDRTLQPDADVRIDERVSGPFRLTAAGRRQQQELAAKMSTCLTKYIGEVPGATKDLAGYITFTNFTFKIGGVTEKLDRSCHQLRLARPTAVEARTLAALTRSVDTCLDRRRHQKVKLAMRFDQSYRPSLRFSADRTVQSCVDAAWRKQLRAHVAPPALLFVRSPGGVSQTRFDLSRENITRIVGVAALVLLIAVAVTILVGARLVRPLRALTAAAQDPGDHHTRMPVTGRDEIGVLAEALNSLTERRERAEKQRTAMVSDVAHELRTPLTNIRSWLEAIKDGLATPESDPALTDALLREALQLQAIIEDLQDLAEADAAGLRLSRESVPVDGLLAQVVTAHGGGAEAGGVRLIAQAPDRLEVTADPVRLRQAIGNLVANAIRYSSPGGSVRLQAEVEGDEVLISVTDEGVGIAAEDLPLVFERFWRADRSRSRDTGGSGLGLAIVRQIVQAHGGSIGVISTLGQGTCFTLRLPHESSVSKLSS